MLRIARGAPLVSVFVVLVLASAACSTSGREENQWALAVDSTSSCPVCPDQSDFVDDIVEQRSEGAFRDGQSQTPAAKFESDLAACYQVGQMPWENENAPGQNEDTAFNCRDFSRWFIECMNRLGHSDVEGLSVWCKNCSSGQSYSHRIVAYQNPDGEWCPGEPQREAGGEIGACCDTDKSRAQQCALDNHCGSYAQRDACCEPSKYAPQPAGVCKQEKCRYEIDINGVPHLNCDLPVIGVPGGPDVPGPGSGTSESPEEKACKAAVKACLAANPASCGDCKRNKVPGCPEYTPPPRETPCQAAMRACTERAGEDECRWCAQYGRGVSEACPNASDRRAYCDSL